MEAVLLVFLLVQVINEITAMPAKPGHHRHTLRWPSPGDILKAEFNIYPESFRHPSPLRPAAEPYIEYLAMPVRRHRHAKIEDYASADFTQDGGSNDVTQNGELDTFIQNGGSNNFVQNGGSNDFSQNGGSNDFVQKVARLEQDCDR